MTVLWAKARPGRRDAAALVAVLGTVAAGLLAVVVAQGFGATLDEGAHLAAGLQWWAEHRYTYEPRTPPLARIVVAFLPWLHGARPQGVPDIWAEGAAILSASDDAGRVLFLARLGTLVFFAVASFVVWRLTSLFADRATAAVAVLAFVSLPPILGNAGVAATDMAHAAMLSLLILVWIEWLDQPTRGHAALLGIAGALAILAKFTTLAYFPVCALGLGLWRGYVGGFDARRWPSGRSIFATGIIAIPIAALIVWAFYGFSIGPLLYVTETGDTPASRPEHHGLIYTIANLPIFPADRFWRGLMEAAHRNGKAEGLYLLGTLRPGRSVLFFPVSFLIKTPIPFLMLSALGAVVSMRDSLRRNDWRVATPLIAALCIFAAAILTTPNLGIRFILTDYVLLSATAATGAVWLWRNPPFRRYGRAAVSLLAASSLAVAIAARDDYLGWFNAVAASDPARFEVTGDLDWGQEGAALAQRLRALGVTDVKLALAYYSDDDELRRVGMPSFTMLRPGERATGWIAANMFALKTKPGYQWLNDYKPVASVRHAVQIYHIEP